MWPCGAFSASMKARTMWRSAIVWVENERWPQPSNISQSHSLPSTIAAIWSNMPNRGLPIRRCLTKTKMSTSRARWSASTLCTNTWTWPRTWKLIKFVISVDIVDTIIGDIFFRNEEQLLNDSDGDDDTTVTEAIAKRVAKKSKEKVNAMKLFVKQFDELTYKVTI